MGTGKTLAILGAVIGLVSVGFSFILPGIFGWYRIEASAMGMTVGVYFSGFGTLVSTGGMPPIGGVAILELIGGLVLVLGAVLCIIGAIKEMKALGIVGGILMILSPMFLVLDLLVLSPADFAIMIEGLGGPSGASPFWGSIVITGPPDVLLSWGIWIGSFITLGAGVLGLIGGAKL